MRLDHLPAQHQLPGKLAGLTLALLLASACASTGTDVPDESSAPPAVEPYDPADHRRRKEPIGTVLLELDLSMEDWNKLILTARSTQQRRQASLLEKDIMRRVHINMDELVTQLETGPPANRTVAAMALGFSRDRAVLSPLLAALEDPKQAVVNNALLGLALLGQADTPLGGAAILLREAPDPTTRHNAAYALLHCVNNGSDPAVALESSSLGLADEHPGVRAQCALVLAAAGDMASLDDLIARLSDDVQLAASAAARALGSLARGDNHQKGKVARALASALQRTDGSLRVSLLRELARLAGVNFGEETEPWVEWAHRLP
jgi:hypothetical protein